MRTTEQRALAMVGAVAIVFSIVGTRLYYLQVVHGNYYQGLQRADYQRAVPVQAPRGKIVSAGGVTLATSKPSWTLYDTDPERAWSREEFDRLGQLLRVAPAQLKQQLHAEHRVLMPYDPVPLAVNLTAKQATRITVYRSALPHIALEPVPERDYPYGATMGNILGYISQPTPTTTVGSAGLEAAYQPYLAGRSGDDLAMVTSAGQLVKITGGAAARPGDTVHLTIDWRLEQTAQKALAFNIRAFDDTKGSIGYAPRANAGGVIAIDPQNGHILAMASYPSYNPQKLVPDNPTERDHYWQQLAANPANPFEIRPIAGLYAPGSVFKPIMAVAALASKTVTPVSKIFDPGYFPPIPTFHNWYPPGFGWLNIKQALGLSDDVFFYTLGYRMGIHTMDQWMERFQLNRRTGIDLPGEVRSRIPTPTRLYRETGLTWTPGWNLNTVIGQGISQYTLIALARADSAIANGGTLYQPQLVSSITTPSGRMVKQFHPVVQGKIRLPAKIWHTVHRGMELSAQDADIAHTGVSGTGYPTLQGFPVSVASKTGTAQKGNGTGYNNAFFLTYGPMAKHHSRPTLLIICYVHDGNWGANSGYIARAIYDQYFKVKDPEANVAFQRTFGTRWTWPFGYRPSRAGALGIGTRAAHGAYPTGVSTPY